MSDKCKHEWVYDSTIIATNPPITRRICKKCGVIQKEKGHYIDAFEFDRVVEKFKRKKKSGKHE